MRDTRRTTWAIGAATLVATGIVVALIELAAARRVTYRAEHRLLDTAPETVHQSGQPLRATITVLGYDRRQAFFQHPPATHRFSEVPSRNATLDIAPAVLEQAWQTDTDGVGFTIRCLGQADDWTPLFSTSVSPDHPAQHGWNDRSISLARCRQPTTDLEFATDCGPKHDCRWDWAVWGEPTVRTDAELKLRPERLAFLISIDTLRRDRVGVYGNTGGLTPNLDRLADDGILFERALAQSSWTLPSHASMFASQFPLGLSLYSTRVIPEEPPLLPELFAGAGWQTGAVVDGAWVRGLFGFARGFAVYQDAHLQSGPARGAAANLSELMAWLNSTDDRPAFAFWHIFDVHGPYGARQPLAGRLRASARRPPRTRRMEQTPENCHRHLDVSRYVSDAELLAAYDEGVMQADAAIGRLVHLLAQTGRYDDALIVVTSDHGESMLERGDFIGHGVTLTDELIGVPLLVKLPGNRLAGKRVPDLVRLVDIAPTMLAAFDINPPPSFRGKSLFPILDGSEGGDERVAYGSLPNDGLMYVQRKQAKLIHRWLPALAESDPCTRGWMDGLPRQLLFDLSTDPEENTSLASTRDWPRELTDLAARHLTETAQERAQFQEPARPELSPTELRLLESLGYVADE